MPRTPISLCRALTLWVCAVCLPVVALPGSASAQTHGSSKRPGASADRSAHQLVQIFRASQPMPPLAALAVTIEGDEKATMDNGLKKIMDAARAVTGESLSGQSGAQIVIAYLTWLRSRRPITTEKIAIYEARVRIIDLSTIDAWQAAEAKTGHSGNSRLLTLAAIAFHDFLFDGPNWAKGNPAKALARLGSLAPDSVSQWKATAKGGSFEEPAFAAWSLIAVDGFFVNDVFQPQSFDAALPIAKTLLSGQ